MYYKTIVLCLKLIIYINNTNMKNKYYIFYLEIHSTPGFKPYLNVKFGKYIYIILYIIIYNNQYILL